MEVLVLGLIVAVALLAAVGFVVVSRRGRDPSAPAPPRLAPPPTPPPLGDRLARTRHAVGDRLGNLFGRGRVDEEFFSELEETLITGDVGVGTATAVVERVRGSKPADTAAAHDVLQAELRKLFAGRDRSLNVSRQPAVIVIVGVNGTGKTTSIAKLAYRYVGEGKQVVLGAADTFRAGASEQLKTWADRVGAEFVGGEPKSDPAAVAFRALERGTETGADLVIIDTAGRLHSNRNLMEELGKIIRVLTREAGSIDETLLVLDATTGQNAIAQAHTFTDVGGVTGIVLSKLDGTARGGVVVAIEQDLDIPVKLIGLGEGMEDLVTFEPDSFIGALLGDSG
jgi:fused signal recognition particle receptor